MLLSIIGDVNFALYLTTVYYFIATNSFRTGEREEGLLGPVLQFFEFLQNNVLLIANADDDAT